MVDIGSDSGFTPAELDAYIVTELGDRPYTTSDSDEHWIEPDGPSLLYEISSYADIEFHLAPLGITYSRHLGFMNRNPGKYLDWVNGWHTRLVQIEASFDADNGGYPVITAHAPIRDLNDTGVLAILERAAERAEDFVGPSLVHFMDDEYLGMVTGLLGWPETDDEGNMLWEDLFAEMACPRLPKNFPPDCESFTREWAAEGLGMPFIPGRFAGDLHLLGSRSVGTPVDTESPFEELIQIDRWAGSQPVYPPVPPTPREVADGARRPRFFASLPPEDNSTDTVEYCMITERIAVFERRNVPRGSQWWRQARSEVKRLAADLEYMYELAHAVTNWPEAILLVVDEDGHGVQRVIWLPNDLQDAPRGLLSGMAGDAWGGSPVATRVAIGVLEELWLKDRQGEWNPLR